MSRYTHPPSGPQPVIIPGSAVESKRDRKRRETVNKVEMLHEEAWRTRDEFVPPSLPAAVRFAEGRKFSQLYKQFHDENKSVNSQPPTSSRYLLRLYPHTIERDALIEASGIDYQYKWAQAKKMYESERESIEAQYWDARDQVRQRLLGAIEERRRKLREEKEGGDVVSETLLDAQIKSRPTRRMPARARISGSASRAGTPPTAAGASGLHVSTPPPGNPTKPNDLLLHNMLAPALAQISTDDIINPSSSSLAVIPASVPLNVNANPNKRGPRGKDAANGDKDAVPAAPGTLTALAIASGQQSTNPRSSRNAGASQGQWVLGKSLAELKKMESASQLEIESDWARIQGGTGRGRRTRGD